MISIFSCSEIVPGLRQTSSTKLSSEVIKFRRFWAFSWFEKKGFLRHFGKLLPLEESFTDWLVVKLRPLRKQKLSLATFHSHYLEEKKFSEKGERNKFFMLLQFLNYAQNLDYESGALGSTAYRQVIFQVKDLP